MIELTKKEVAEKLEEAYCIACNALEQYRIESGFIPDARVIAKYREEPEKTGVIAPYGDMWREAKGFIIPVIIDGGATQMWAMSNLRLEMKK